MPEMGEDTFVRLRLSGGSGSYILLPVLTTAQRDALAAEAGQVIYNSSTGQVENYNGSAWVAVGKLYGDATFLPLAGGALTGDVTVAATKTIDGVDISAHAADLDAHTKNLVEVERTGEYFSGSVVVGSTDTFAITANQLYGMPLVVVRDKTVDRIAIEVFTASGVGGSTARLGIYNLGTNLYPGSLLLDAGTVATSAAAIVTIAISQALPKGIYFLSLLASHGFTMIREVMYLELLGWRGAPQDAVSAGHWKVALAYGALPDPFTAGGDRLTSYPLVGLRIASLD